MNDLDHRIEAAAWRGASVVVHLSPAEVKRIDAGLALLRLRESEAPPRIPSPEIQDAITESLKSGRL